VRSRGGGGGGGCGDEAIETAQSASHTAEVRSVVHGSGGGR